MKEGYKVIYYRNIIIVYFFEYENIFSIKVRKMDLVEEYFE